MSSLFSFDPDAGTLPPVAVPAEQPPEHDAADAMPDEWQAGLEILREMPLPHGATPERWSQIVEDANVFAERWHRDAIAAGWTIGALFGFDLDAQHNFVGLVLDIRGGRVVAINPEYASIRKVDGYRWHYRHMPDNSSPLWRMRRPR